MLKPLLNIAFASVSFYNSYQATRNLIGASHYEDAIERVQNFPIDQQEVVVSMHSKMAKKLKFNAFIYNLPVLAACCFTALFTKGVKPFLLGTALGVAINFGPLAQIRNGVMRAGYSIYNQLFVDRLQQNREREWVQDRVF
jgi:hypothetical protein